MDADETHAIVPKNLSRHVKMFLAHKGKNRSPVDVAFYGGNFLGMERNKVLSFLEAATALVHEGTIEGIRFSTRPDTITPDQLDILTGFPIAMVELGVQSMDDRVLSLSRRGHTADDTVKAMMLLKEKGFRSGVQLMVGLPGDTEDGSLESAEKAAALDPDCVRIYPAVVLKGSLLADWYARGIYEPMPLDACVGLVKKLFLFFRQEKIRVIRMGLQPSETLQPESHLLAGPFHPAFGHLVQSEIFRDTVVSCLERNGVVSDSITLRMHPCLVPKMAGQANQNIAFLKSRFHIDSVVIRQDSSCPKNLLFVEGASIPAPC